MAKWTDEGFELTVYTHYYAEVVPPRCRNARALKKCDEIKVVIPRIFSSEAPVAMRIMPREGVEPNKDYHDGDIFLCKGELWMATPNAEKCLSDRVFGIWCEHRELTNSSEYLFQEKEFNKELPEWDNYHKRKNKYHQYKAVQDWANQFAFIDDLLVRRVGEPVYTTYTTSWGRHLGIDVSFDVEEYVYNALEKPLIDERITKHLSHKEYSVSWDREIEVLIPEAVAFPSHAENEQHHAYSKAFNKLQEVAQDVCPHFYGVFHSSDLRHCVQCSLVGSSDSQCVAKQILKFAEPFEEKVKELDRLHNERIERRKLF